VRRKDEALTETILLLVRKKLDQQRR